MLTHDGSPASSITPFPIMLRFFLTVLGRHWSNTRPLASVFTNTGTWDIGGSTTCLATRTLLDLVRVGRFYLFFRFPSGPGALPSRVTLPSSRKTTRLSFRKMPLTWPSINSVPKLPFSPRLLATKKCVLVVIFPTQTYNTTTPLRTIAIFEASVTRGVGFYAACSLKFDGRMRSWIMLGPPQCLVHP